MSETTRIVAAQSTDEFVSDGESSQSARTVRNGNVAGVRLGMSLAEAVTAIEAAGFDVRKYNARCLGHESDQENPCYRSSTGMTLKRIPGPSAFEGGFSALTVRLKGDQVYWVRKVDSFLLSRLPAHFDTKGLIEKYKASYPGRFADAKYQRRDSGSRSHLYDLDGQVAPPWRGAVTSPHAQVSIGAVGSGRYSTVIEMHWKERVGVEW